MIVREGIPFILIAFVLTFFFIWAANRWNSSSFFTVAIIFGILTLFVTFFFRDPDRIFKPTEGLLIAPADGKVVQIIPIADDPYIGGGAIQISIFLSVFDVHVNRIPVSGVVEYVKYNPGKFFAAFEDKASQLNEQTEIGILTKQKNKVKVKQIAGLIARRIVCKLSQDDTVKTGERFGLIRFGSRTDLIVPASTDIQVAVGDKVVGGETTIGLLKNLAISKTALDSTGSRNVDQ